MPEITEDRVDRFAREILRLREEYEFATFWLGAHVPGPVSQEEAIELKKQINRRVSERTLELGIQAEPTPVHPVVRIQMNWATGEVEITVEPLLVYGRYLKLSREIPQSRWPCRLCRGKGCDSCGGTGKRYFTSIEELAAAPLLAATRAERTKMHSVGREDVDARMLGRGRPFILQLTQPRVRNVALGPIEEQLNRAHADTMAVREMRIVDRAMLEKLVRLEPDKSYRAEVRCLVPARREPVERLAEIRDVTLEQETPRRVLHRRPNRLRRRVVRECAVEISDAGETVRRFHLTLRVQSGTYIKEFISGDEGRTRPSVSHMLRVPCECAELDVTDVHVDPLLET
jgi:tRNA pseudouridine synthase 10